MNEPTPTRDLSEHEEEAEPFDDVMRKLLGAKPAPRKTPLPKDSDPQRDPVS